MLTVGSLFAGIGGFDLGLEWTGGFRAAWFCEQDAYCQRVLAYHWPDVPCYADVRGLTGADVEPVDVLCGGFPCQDLSFAGAGAGLAGERSGLWGEYARLVGELRPRYVLVENVAALLARGLGVVLGDLAALGYDAEWDCLPASAVGAPHQRDRLWLVAYPAGDDGRPRREGRPSPSGARQPVTIGALPHPDTDHEGRGVVAEHDSGPVELGGRSLGRHVDGFRDEVADANGAGREERRWTQPVRTQQPPAECRRESERTSPRTADWWAVEPDVGRVAHGIPARVDRLRALGNALVPQIAYFLGRRILEWEAA